MKKIAIYSLALMVAAIFFAGCEKGISPIENGVYLQEAAPSQTFGDRIETQLIDEDEVVKSLTVRMAKATDEDVKANLDIDYDFLDEYNEEKGVSYKVLPEEYFSFDRSVTIKAGEVAAPEVNLTIKPYDASTGESYAIPIRITSVEGPVDLVGSAYRILYLLNSPNKQRAVTIRFSRMTQVNFKEEFHVSQWTVEYWLRMDNITGIPTGSWVGPSLNNFRARVVSRGGYPISLNGLGMRLYPDKELPVMNCQMDGAAFDSQGFMWPDTWYHIAYTYDGATVRLYINGTLNASKDFTHDFVFKTIMIGRGATLYRTQGEFAQIRIWNKCLSEMAIQDGMSRLVSPNSEGLLGYWKCDEGEGNVLKDSTTNGNDITLQDNAQRIKWSEVYNFYHPND